MHAGSLEDFMTGANGEDADTFELTDGPFGFGYAVGIRADNQECLVKQNYESAGDCTKDPNICSKGFSISIWEKAEFSYDIFWTINNLENEPKRYVLSTGGDEEGHPGIAIYHQGISLVAIVSTGDEYWKLEVYGPFHNSTWNNIGILWSRPLGDLGGLEMHVNHRRVGTVFKGRASTRKSPLNPPELMIGCHKDSDNRLYRGYNDAEFDELALWKRSLLDNETMFFLGGYGMKGEMSFIDPEEYQVMLEKTDLKDPSQLVTAFKVLSQMNIAHRPENTTEDGAMNNTLRLQTVMSSLTNPENVKRGLAVSDWTQFLDIIHATSNLLDDDSEDTWRVLEAKGKPGSTEVARDFEGFYLDLLEKVSLDGETRLDYTKTSENIAARCEKTRIRDFMSASSYVSPDYSQMKSLYSEWDRPMDKIFVPTNIFTDERCLEREVSILTVLYDTFDDVAPNKVSKGTILPSRPNYLDSRVLSVRVKGVPKLDAEGRIVPSSPMCYPDPDTLSRNPMKIILEHTVKEKALRRMLFHDEEPTTKINYRHCVRWNDRYQMWDSDGCRVEDTTTTYTRCSCRGFGSFAIMVEEIEPIVAPEIPEGMILIIKIGYLVSMICLLLYMLIVGFSGDLKDQHHLVGLNMAGCLLLGDLMVLLTYLLPIQEGRHNCAIVGSLIHGFFLAAGGWMAMMGHTAFKTITAGVIGGKLRSYFFLSWGITISSIGVTYMAFLRHLGTDPRCFISWTNEVKGVFFVPQLGFCIAAVFFVCIVFFNLHTASLRNGNILADYRSFSIGSSVLALYFSTTWAIGCAALIRWEGEVPNLYPIYEILNSFTGLVLLLCIGFGSRRFRMSLSGQYKKKRQMLNDYRNKSDDAQPLGSPEDQPRPISAASTVIAQ
ncbi:adhesion G-protein coupled receptor D1-like [Penaeus monodon]|uniref:adhesion G-protein coupled receptor D1-like n=1 Tax=Penaeus monodon TaxID=6687 RepID=UPI0018A79F5C|nr:adhesion G-protein coupled receptor D1-like [Penaeus monodon]